MKTTIKTDTEIPLMISTEELDNLNFVDIWFGGDKEYTVPINELYFAVKAFYEKSKNKN